MPLYKLHHRTWSAIIFAVNVLAFVKSRHGLTERTSGKHLHHRTWSAIIFAVNVLAFVKSRHDLTERMSGETRQRIVHFPDGGLFIESRFSQRLQQVFGHSRCIPTIQILQKFETLFRAPSKLLAREIFANVLDFPSFKA
jgi:hypothetical protein